MNRIRYHVKVLESMDVHVDALVGIIGARHYMPGVDLIGIHRIDLTVHQWSKERIAGRISW